MDIWTTLSWTVLSLTGIVVAFFIIFMCTKDEEFRGWTLGILWFVALVCSSLFLFVRK